MLQNRFESESTVGNLIGYGKLRVSSAKLLVEQNTPVPVFIQRASKKWEFIGYYRGKEYSEASSEIYAESESGKSGGAGCRCAVS